MNELTRCPICGESFEYGSMYEYRGAISCSDCFNELQQRRDFERQQIIEEERHKTDRFKGLDLSDSSIGKANRGILKQDIEIGSKESDRIKDYEGRK